MSVLEVNLTQEEQIEIRVEDRCREIAKVLKTKGVSVEVISESFAMTVEEVEQL